MVKSREEWVWGEQEEAAGGSGGLGGLTGSGARGNRQVDTEEAAVDGACRQGEQREM